MRIRFVLASASPARRRLLRDAGFAPDVIVSGVDESIEDGTSTVDAVAQLAQRKVDAVVRTVDQALEQRRVLVLGCDSLLEIDGTSFGKPACADDARATWRARRGRAGVLHTGHALVDVKAGTRLVATASTTIHFGRPSDSEIDAYVATGEPLEVAGGFTIDGRGAVFVDRIEGDHGNVIGLSLPLLRVMLEQLDTSVVDLWT